MRLLMALLLATGAVAAMPAAEAHQCNGEGCGPCVEGETHQHNDPQHGQCSSGPGYKAENGPDGQSFELPAVGALGIVAALCGAALLLARRA